MIKRHFIIYELLVGICGVNQVHSHNLCLKINHKLSMNQSIVWWKSMQDKTKSLPLSDIRLGVWLPILLKTRFIMMESYKISSAWALHLVNHQLNWTKEWKIYRIKSNKTSKKPKESNSILFSTAVIKIFISQVKGQGKIGLKIIFLQIRQLLSMWIKIWNISIVP